MAKISIEEFGQSVKQKYPAYQNVDDATLWKAMLKKYPQYKKTVQSQWFFPTVLRNTAQAIKQKWQDIVENVKWFEQKRAWLVKEQWFLWWVKAAAQLPREALQIGGDIAWAITAPAWEAMLEWARRLPEWIKAPIKSALNTVVWTPLVQKWIQDSQEFAEKNPETAKTLWAVGSLVDVATLWAWSKIAATTAKEWVETAAKQVVKKTWEAVEGVKATVTRKIPIGRVEKDLWLTPTERAIVENTWESAGQFVLKKNIWWMPKEKQINELQRIADEWYNWMTREMSTIATRVESQDAKNMLETMVDEMSSSKIVTRERWPYIEKLKELMEQQDYSPSELLAIRRDFDRIVWQDIFNKMGRVSGEEDKIISWWRRNLSDQLEEIGKANWLDVKDMNNDIRNSITIRNWLLRRLSQENKNNTFWLQDLWVWAILSAWDPVAATAIIVWKKALEKATPWIAQSLYNLWKWPYVPTNLKRGVPITPADTTNGLSITPSPLIGRSNVGVKWLTPITKSSVVSWFEKEAIRYNNVDDFINNAKNPKTVNLWIKSKFSDEWSYKDIPVIRTVKDKTLYQWWSWEWRQFWTTNKKYAEQFWRIQEKTGTFYQVDNGNRVVDVYIEAPTEIELRNLWQRVKK